MFMRIFSVLIASFLFVACAGEKSVKVSSMQKKDKNLSCREIMLEINEAEFYRNTAEKNKNPGIKSLLMPLGYVSTYLDAEEAAGAADARISYLNRVYDIMKCDEPGSDLRRAAYPPYSDYNMGAGGGNANSASFAPPAYVPQAGGYRTNQPMVIRDDWY